MECLRCGGLMIKERFRDFLEDMKQLEFKGFRCLVCGEILDHKILKHRQTLEPALVS